MGAMGRAVLCTGWRDSRRRSNRQKAAAGLMAAPGPAPGGGAYSGAAVGGGVLTLKLFHPQKAPSHPSDAMPLIFRK